MMLSSGFIDRMQHSSGIFLEAMGSKHSTRSQVRNQLSSSAARYLSVVRSSLLGLMVTRCQLAGGLIGDLLHEKRGKFDETDAPKAESEIFLVPNRVWSAVFLV